MQNEIDSHQNEDEHKRTMVINKFSLPKRYF